MGPSKDAAKARPPLDEPREPARELVLRIGGCEAVGQAAPIARRQRFEVGVDLVGGLGLPRLGAGGALLDERGQRRLLGDRREAGRRRRGRERRARGGELLRQCRERRGIVGELVSAANVWCVVRRAAIRSSVVVALACVWSYAARRAVAGRGSSEAKASASIDVATSSRSATSRAMRLAS